MYHTNLNYKNNYTISSKDEINEINDHFISSKNFHNALKELKNKNQSYNCSDQDLNNYLNNELSNAFLANFAVQKAFLNGKENHNLEIEIDQNLCQAILEISSDISLLKKVFQNEFICLNHTFLISSSLKLLRFLLYQKLIYFINVYKAEFRTFIRSPRLELISLINDRDFWLLFTEKLKRNKIEQIERYQYKDDHFFSNYILKYIYQILIDSEYAYDKESLKNNCSLSILINKDFPSLTTLKNPNEIHVLEYDEKLIIVLHRFDEVNKDKSQSINDINSLNDFLKNIDINLFNRRTNIDSFVESSIKRYEEIEHGRYIYADQMRWYFVEENIHQNLSKRSIQPFHFFPAFLVEDKNEFYSYLKQMTEMIDTIRFIRMTSSVILNLCAVDSLILNKQIERKKGEIELDYSINEQKIDVSMFGDMELDQIQLAERNGKIYRLTRSFKNEVKSFKDLTKLVNIKQGRLKLAQFPYLANFLDKGQNLKLGSDYESFITGLIDSKELETDIDSSIDLYSYQKKAISWLNFLYEQKLSGILADEMGLGKTIQVASFIEYKKFNSVLILCPTSIITNWLTELRKFKLSDSIGILHADFPFKENKNIYLSTYHSFNNYDLTKEKHFELIVFDEIQILKNDKSKLHQNVLELKARMKLGLTGTPLENSLMDLWSIFNSLNFELLPERKKFKQAFVDQYKKYIKIGATEDAKHSRNTLQSIVSPFILRRKKSDSDVFVELPEKITKTVNCKLTDQQEKLYKQLIYDYQQSIRDKDNIFEDKQLIITLFLRLKQLCNHAAFIDKNFDRLKERSGKLSELDKLVHRIIGLGDKLIIFSQFRETCDLLETYLNKRYPVLKITGEDKIDERNLVIKDFNQKDDHQILIMSLKTGGLGLNLTVANHVIHYDRWWNPAVEEQASDRIYRIGQKKEVSIYRFITEKTIEESIEELIKTKKKLFEDFIEESDFVNQLSTSDIKTIIKDIK